LSLGSAGGVIACTHSNAAAASSGLPFVVHFTLTSLSAVEPASTPRIQRGDAPLPLAQTARWRARAVEPKS